jgi:hypothetical protein
LRKAEEQYGDDTDRELADLDAGQQSQPVHVL